MSEELGNGAETGPQPLVRQWVAVPGGSCDARFGPGAVEQMGPILKSAVGRPQDAALVVAAGVGEGLAERVRRQLTDAGFLVHPLACPSQAPARTLPALSDLLHGLAGAHITSDDLVCAIGDVDALSLCAHAAAAWCGGVPLVSVPLDLRAMVEVPCTPRALDVAGRSQMAGLRAATRYLICDPEVMDLSTDGEHAACARALMVATAVAESEKSFSTLWDKASDIMGGDVDLVGEAVVSALKSRGHLATSTALAIRQSLEYGQTFTRALGRLTQGSVRESILMAEALRFAARISAGLGRLPVDDVLAQDELLDMLGLGYARCDVEPDRLVAALKEERFLRTNRFLLAVPNALGRVRMTTVDDGLLAEHAGAWCQAHATGA